MNDRYDMDGSCMYITRSNGQIDVMVQELGHIWTLTERGVAKHAIEEDMQ